MDSSLQFLISIPAGGTHVFHDLFNRAFPQWVASCDPPGTKLGSGGGTAHLLVESWRASGKGMSFAEWLEQSTKVLVHAGGQSRRLPAYAPIGKIGVPIPVMRWMRGQRLDQTLLDLQEVFLREFATKISSPTIAMVASGDALLQCSMDKLGLLPDADIVLVGLLAPPETARNHGVFFCNRNEPARLAFALQKPTIDTIRQHSEEYHFLIDSGLWLLSARAITVLMGKCGWNEKCRKFRENIVSYYDLYTDFSKSLGDQPLSHDDEIGSLSCAVTSLPDGEFYHFGTNRDLIQSCSRLADRRFGQKEPGSGWVKPHSEMFVLNAPKKSVSLTPENNLLWIENAAVTENWRLESKHVITGVPANHWNIHVPRGICLDMIPIKPEGRCIRVYGFDDPFRGPLGESETLWCAHSALSWLSDRALSPEDAGIDPESDIQQAPLFPIVSPDDISGEFVQWLIDPRNLTNAESCRHQWLNSERIGAEQIASRADLKKLSAQRRECIEDVLPVLAQNASRNVFYLLDLDHTAGLYAATSHPVARPGPGIGLMNEIHHSMFTAAVGRYRKERVWREHEARAFGRLRQAYIDSIRQQPVSPQSTVLEDQIVWARSPLRIDLAGGWTDTPPFCIEQGGHVINVAVNLNGQPPIQVFARRTDSPEIVIRSIDLGVEERIHSLDALTDYANVRSAFSVAKAAVCLAGFDPVFSASRYTQLSKVLGEFGGGIELSLLAAVPKGSGLGTSSILAATVFGALNDLCGLGWDHSGIFTRVLVLEQMLTAGGGWQDQVGGVTRGLKYIESAPGLIQSPQVRWLADHIFTDQETRQCMLLYYTGVTRVAKNILQEIVRGMFLNRGLTQSILQEMVCHAAWSYDELIRGSYAGLCQCVKKSWELNQSLDSGTNPPAVQAILERVGDLCAAAKLAGAGGGGYLFMLAKDPQAAVGIRNLLENDPLNSKGRFVECRVSAKGMEVTRS